MKFIHGYWQAHRLWSVRLAAVAGMFTTWVITNPAQVSVALAAVPDQYRPLVASAVGLSTFALPTLVRLISQPSLPTPPHEGN